MTLVTAIIVAGLLVSCGSESGTKEDRKFANDPVSTSPTSPATEVESTATVVAPATVPLASPASVLESRGAPETFYALVDGTIAVLDAGQSERERFIVADGGAAIVAIAASPSGNRVSALQLDPTGAMSVVVYDPTGAEQQRWAMDAAGEGPSATPVPEASASPGTIAWSAEGRRLLVTIGGAYLVSIDVGGEMEEIAVPSRIGEIVDGAWSPRGDEIAVLARDSQGRGIVWVFDPANGEDTRQQVVPPNADAANLGSVTAFAWMPNGSGLAYILAPQPGPEYPGGELHTIDLASGIRSIVATPGRVGPAAAIVGFAVAPDGKAIAYTIATPAGDGWTFDSLWVRSLKMANIETLPVFGVDQVSTIWWVSSGVAWEQQTGELASIVLQPAEATGTVTIFAESTAVATPAPGTPGATPVLGTPGATPVLGTPAATPVPGTPAATPVLGTPSVSPGMATPVATHHAGTPVASPVAATPIVGSPAAGTPPVATPATPAS